MKSEPDTEIKVEPQPKVTSKKAVVSSRKHSVTSSDSDVVQNKIKCSAPPESSKGNRSEPPESGKGKKVATKSGDGKKHVNVLENVEAPELPETSTTEGTDKENVVTVRMGCTRKRKAASQGILMQKSSSTHLSDFSDGGETDATIDHEEERFQRKFKSKVSASKSKAKTLSGGNKQSSELQQQKEKSRASWFGPNKFDTNWIKHPKEVVKELPDNAEIYCTKCNEVFSTSDELTKHEKECFKGRCYKCIEDSCSKMFSQKSLMHQHYKEIHLDDPFLCRFCQEPCIYLKSLEKHENTKHNAKKTFKYSCTMCSKQTDDHTEFQVHVNHHTNIKPYKCNICEASYFSQSQLTAHMKTHNVLSNPKFECSVCGQKLSMGDHYHEHLKSQHIDTVMGEVYYCEVCISRSFTVKGFNKHCGNCTG